ncbi:Hypothetical protein A7982_05805 [Minicystis rosea]|nr:Hypothetical protein A7982_05805 [Minicystis rosea]
MAHDERDGGDPSADELAILRLVARLAQASDDRDETAYRVCFADTVQSGSPGGLTATIPAEEYARQAIARLSRTDWTHHKLANPIVRVDTHRARATARIDVVVEIAATSHGRQQHATIGGRYELSFVRANGAWRIDGRVLHQRYVLGVLDFELRSPA